MTPQTPRPVNVFNVEAQKTHQVSLPPEGMVIQTIYQPDPEASRLRHEVPFSDKIQRAQKGNPAMIIVCADIENDNKPYQYFVVNERSLKTAGLSDYPAIRKSAIAAKDTARKASVSKIHEKRRMF